MKSIVILNTTRTDYSAERTALRTLTVGDLMGLLEDFDPESPVIFSNDNGYTYGRLTWDTVTEVEPEEPGEDQDEE